MSKLYEELNKTAYKINDEVETLLKNPKFKATKRKKDFIVTVWQGNLIASKENVDSMYDKMVFHSFISMLSFMHADKLKYDEFMKYFYVLVDMLKNVKSGDFNEE